MPEFTNSFWPWFICVTTIASLAGIVWLARWLSRGRRPEPGQRPESMGHVWDGDLEELNNPLPRWWLNMFYITLIFGPLYLILYPGVAVFGGILGWNESKQYQDEMTAAERRFGPVFDRYSGVPITALVNDADALRIGERLFSTYCTPCHGSDARGVRGFPNLRDNDWLYGGTPEDIEQTILNGRRGAMPPWGAILGDSGVFQVTEYVRGLSGREVNAVVAANGRGIYIQYCSVCHGPDGAGNREIGAPNLTDNIWLHGGSQERMQETIANGRNSVMPAHREFLGTAKVHLLAAYIFGLRLDKDADG